MCRHFGYLGPPVSLAELVLDPPHSLAVQSYAPTDMRGGGKVNVDGFGVGWFSEDGSPASARHYRRAVPIWQDRAFAELARGTVAGGVLAAVRNATVGMPVADAACAPFTDGQWLFSLNGRIADWPDSAVWLADSVPRRELLSIQVMTDATLLWAVLRHRLAASDDPASALAGLITEVLAAAPGSRLTTLLTDGQQILGTTVTHALCWRRSAAGVLVASEPFDDDPEWQSIPDGQLVVADRDAVRYRPLTSDRDGQSSDARNSDDPSSDDTSSDDTGSESHVHQRR